MKNAKWVIEKNQAILYGIPEDHDDHNCDLMGCSSVGGHVLRIVELPEMTQEDPLGPVNINDETPDQVPDTSVMENALDSIWEFIYPRDKSWEYPGQVVGHIKMVVKEKNRKIKELKNKLSEKESNSSSVSNNHADQFKNTGIINKYKITKADGSSVDPDAEYFVLRLDDKGKDPIHVKACRAAVQEYAKQIANHLPILSAELLTKYGTPNKE